MTLSTWQLTPALALRGQILALKYGLMLILEVCRIIKILLLVVESLDMNLKKRLDQEYDKTDERLYIKLLSKGSEEEAIQIAENKLNKHISDGKINPSEMVPATTVHWLIDEIKRKSRN